MIYKFSRHIIYWIAAILFAVTLFPSCSEDSPDIKKEEKINTTILLYAIASNNLYSNLIDDKEEILEAANDMDMKGLRMLVYQITPYELPSLLEVKKSSSGTYVFETVKEYDKELYSTDPERISQVINDVKLNYDSDLYGLILWSHGKGLDPFTSTRSEGTDHHPIFHSFGSDKDSDKDPNYSDEIDIDDLADAIPDHMFNFIWFDACYMSGIETIYELRNKCDYFVGYPTEVYSPGMPYNLTLSHILSVNPDLTGAAEVFFKFYAENPDSRLRAATVCVVDMDRLEDVADYCRATYPGTPAPSTSGILKYTRGSIGPFYDFGKVTKAMAEINEEAPDIEEFTDKMNKMVLYSAATESDFNYNFIKPEDFSGISCHVFVDNGSKKAEFYKTLDWYKRVYQ